MDGIIHTMTNYSLILALNFSVNFYFHICNYKFAMVTRRMSQCQDGVKVLKCYEWRYQGIKRRFRKPKHTKEYIKKGILSTNTENYEFNL